MNREIGIRACHACGLVHRVPQLGLGQLAKCTRCQATIQRFGSARKNVARTAALALGAFFLYWPAILLPILQTERWGHRHTTSLLRGTVDLIRDGSLFVGTVVLLFSIVLPLLKIVLLLELSLVGLIGRKHRAWIYRTMEYAGKWGMMDVMLLAFLVMLVKLGDLVSFKFGPAVVAFVSCVSLSILAALSFDPHAAWETEA